MRPELRTEMLRILEELSEGEIVVLQWGDERLSFEAVSLLEEHGALEETESTSSYRITISGYDYYQELKAPWVYWFTKNWFPVAVLAVTVIANGIVAWLN